MNPLSTPSPSNFHSLWQAFEIQTRCISWDVIQFDETGLSFVVRLL